MISPLPPSEHLLARCISVCGTWKSKYFELLQRFFQPRDAFLFKRNKLHNELFFVDVIYGCAPYAALADLQLLSDRLSQPKFWWELYESGKELKWRHCDVKYCFHFNFRNFYRLFLSFFWRLKAKTFITKWVFTAWSVESSHLEEWRRSQI